MKLSEKIDKNYEWFIQNRDSINFEPDRPFALIDECRIIDFFSTWENAIEAAKRSNIPAGYIIQNASDKKNENFLGFFSLRV